MSKQIRAFESRDVETVAALFKAYMSETYKAASAMTPDILLRDGQGRHFHLMLAVDKNDAPIGFAAWREAYDLHHAMTGAEIPDLFVSPAYRGRGISVQLVAAIANATKANDGAYIKGEIIADDSPRLKLASRITIGFPGEHVYVSGNTFQTLANLSDADIKTLTKQLAAFAK